MTPGLPPALTSWREVARVRLLNGRSLERNGRYVLCWLQQALRACDNPVIDAAVRLGNALRLPVLVYCGVRENYPYASDRLHRFILGASLDLALGCRARGLAFVRHVDREERREKGLVHRLRMLNCSATDPSQVELSRRHASGIPGGSRRLPRPVALSTRRASQ